VKWLDDINVKKKVFEIMPELTHMYQSAENPIFKTFYIIGKVDFYGNAPGPMKSIDIN
jgi:uncharacterized pyridoxamine 5'-phosphate oxidase family protein